MGWLKRRKQTRQLTKARKRAAMVSTPELYTWIDVTLVEIGRSVRRGEEGRNDAAMYAQALTDILEELQSRAV